MSTIVVSAGVVSSGLLIFAGDTVSVMSGGELVSGQILGGTVDDFGVVSDEALFSGGLAVFSGGASVDNVIAGNGTVMIYAGGSAVGDQVVGSGFEEIPPDAVSEDVIVSSGGSVVLSLRVQPTDVVTLGLQSASAVFGGVTVEAGGYVDGADAAVAENGVLSGRPDGWVGEITVASAGVLTGEFTSGAWSYVAGIISSATLIDRPITLSSGGLAEDIVISQNTGDGFFQMQAGATLSDATLLSGAELALPVGAAVSGLDLGGSSLIDLEQVASASFSVSGDDLLISSGGQLVDTIGLAGDTTALSFQSASDGFGGTLLEVSSRAGAPSDFYGDGTSDILLQDTSGDVFDTPVQNGQLSGAPVYIGTIASGWSFLTTGDLYGNGTSDILLQDTAGDIVDWTISAGQTSGAPGYVCTVAAGWSFLATGDFFGNGTSDLLLENTGGALVDWAIKDGQVSGSPTYVGTIASDWTFLATGDFFGNGGSDLLLENSAGAVVDWEVENGQAAGAPTYVGTIASGWSFLATGDFYGNGVSDILLQDAAGDIVDWTMQNGQASSTSYVGTITGGWSVIAVGDYNGDGTSDLLLQNTDGAMLDWAVKNGQLEGSPVYVGAAVNPWHTLPAHALVGA